MPKFIPPMARFAAGILLIAGIVYLLYPERRSDLVFIGDSLTFGLGVNADKSMPSVIERSLREQGYKYRVHNGGISGSSLKSAAPRVANWKQKPLAIAVFVIALGGMDWKRTDYDNIEREMSEAVEAALTNHSKVLLVAFHIPEQYLGSRHSDRFAQIYQSVARKYQVPLVPNQLSEIEGRPELYLADGEHPNEAGIKIMANTIYPELIKLLTR